MAPTVDIAICFDDKIEAAALVCLASLRAHARADRPTRVFAITDGVSEQGERVIADMRSDAFDVELMKVENLYAGMGSRGYISAGTHLRFLIPDVLATVDKVLYLDVDIVARRDLSPLFDIKLGDHSVAAVPDFSQINSGLTWRPWRIEYEGGAYTFADYTRQVLSVSTQGRRPYFNCGVLLMNLALWRQAHIVESTLSFMRDKPGLRFLDQDAINHIVGSRYVRLDLRWNAFAVHACPLQLEYMDRWKPKGRDWQAIRAVWRSDPWILHYAGANKPWSPTDVPTPYDYVWWDIARTLPHFAEIEADYLGACRAAGRGFEKCAPV